MKAAGFTTRDLTRMRLYASLTPAEFETALERAKTVEATDRAMDREVHRVLHMIRIAVTPRLRGDRRPDASRLCKLRA
jgi:hypothetical protein